MEQLLLGAILTVVIGYALYRGFANIIFHDLHGEDRDDA